MSRRIVSRMRDRCLVMRSVPLQYGRALAAGVGIEKKMIST
jgi:hypothetical protein